MRRARDPSTAGQCPGPRPTAAVGAAATTRPASHAPRSERHGPRRDLRSLPMKGRRRSIYERCAEANEKVCFPPPRGALTVQLRRHASTERGWTRDGDGSLCPRGGLEGASRTRKPARARRRSDPGDVRPRASRRDQVLTDLSRRPPADRVATLDTASARRDAGARRSDPRPIRPARRALPARPRVGVALVGRPGDGRDARSVDCARCCALRKVERSAACSPVARRGSRDCGESSRISARRSRSRPPDDGRVKLNPLADWTNGDVWHYIATFAVPYNPLHDRFFPSIGCAPCTRAVALGENPRAGRWWWEDEAAKECGLHVAAAAPTARAWQADAR